MDGVGNDTPRTAAVYNLGEQAHQLYKELAKLEGNWPHNEYDSEQHEEKIAEIKKKIAELEARIMSYSRNIQLS